MLVSFVIIQQEPTDKKEPTNHRVGSFVRAHCGCIILLNNQQTVQCNPLFIARSKMTLYNKRHSDIGALLVSWSANHDARALRSIYGFKCWIYHLLQAC